MRVFKVNEKHYLALELPRDSTLLVEVLLVIASAFVAGAAYGGRATLRKLKPGLNTCILAGQEAQARLSELQGMYGRATDDQEARVQHEEVLLSQLQTKVQELQQGVCGR